MNRVGNEDMYEPSKILIDCYWERNRSRELKPCKLDEDEDENEEDDDDDHHHHHHEDYNERYNTKHKLVV
jgi:hypothetical protein